MGEMEKMEYNSSFLIVMVVLGRKISNTLRIMIVLSESNLLCLSKKGIYKISYDVMRLKIYWIIHLRP